jgi:hypothetical protein
MEVPSQSRRVPDQELDRHLAALQDEATRGPALFSLCLLLPQLSEKQVERAEQYVPTLVGLLAAEDIVTQVHGEACHLAAV